VTSDGIMRVFFQSEQVCQIPARDLALGGGTPVYQRQAKRPTYLDETNSADLSPYRQKRDWNVTLLGLLASPNICDKSWVTEQYDATVRTNTVFGPGGDTALLWIKDTKVALAVTTDCNPRYVYLNPRRGAALAVAEAARNVSCTGAQPIAITNCLNFGNPYKPESFYFFKEAVAGMGEACRVLETPVTGGNVSFYNESEVGPILPTPVIGMLGVLEDVDKATSSRFQVVGDRIILLGHTGPDLGGSEYLFYHYGVLAGDAPDLDLELEKRTQACLREAIQRGYVHSAHDCSEGGLAVALAECCILDRRRPLGATVGLDRDGLSIVDLLFAETPSRIIVSVPTDCVGDALALAASMQVPAEEIGEVRADRFRIGEWVDLNLPEMQKAYFESLPSFFQRVSAAE
jgi:phosphoribosylformylglycinamidine synthase